MARTDLFPLRGRMGLAVIVALFFGAALLVGSAREARAADAYADFGLGKNLEGQVCWGQWRFGDAATPQAVGVYCGAWDRPSAELTLLPTPDAKAEASRPLCRGPERRAPSDDKAEVYQTECARNGQIGPTPVALRMTAKDAPARGLGSVWAPGWGRSGPRAVQGLSFPADWGPMTAAARVMLGIDRPAAATGAPKHVASDAPLASCPPSTAPAGPSSSSSSRSSAQETAAAPGLCQEVGYLALRRRAFDENAFWNFAAAEQDFANLLSLHRIVAPTDLVDEAEILAEIGINLSAARRRSEAQAFFDRAETLAASLDARSLVKKINLYRAFDALQAGEWDKAETLAGASAMDKGAARSRTAPEGAVSDISSQEARRLTRDLAATGAEKLLVSVSEVSEADRGAILDAQADYIRAVALRRLNKPGVQAALEDAQTLLARSGAAPPWLIALIDQEQAQIDLAAGRPAEARAAIGEAIAQLSAQTSDSRLLADLDLALADVEAATGEGAKALETGRAAIRILSLQSEAPGFSADVAASHLGRLLDLWARTGDAKAAEDYFETLSLVWGGAAARSAVQLAARLADGDNSTSIKAYQNAERRYRAASARRERLAADPNVEPDALAAATRDRDAAMAELTANEGTVRTRAPRYQELLHPEASGESLRASLTGEEGYVRFVLAEAGGFGVLVRKDSVTPFRIALPRSAIDALVNRVRKSVKRSRGRLPDYDVDAAFSLYQALLQPVSSRIQDLKVLHVDASDSLSALPFSALVVAPPDEKTLARIKNNQDYAGVPWLASRYAVDLALGPAAFLRARAPATPEPIGPLLAFGGFKSDPKAVARRLIGARQGLAAIAGRNRCDKAIETALEDLPELPETATEAAADAALAGPWGRAVVGPAFTDTEVTTDPQVGAAQILVFATHGVLGLSDCFPEPALLTSLGPEGEGVLTASRVLDLNLHARLVIMSACDTAGGGRTDAAITGLTDGGEALSGLARSFIYAGARTILATQWKLNAESSGRQTKALLALLETGVPLTAALNKTQAALYEDPDTSHPYFWATFSLVGDGEVRFTAAAPTPVQQATR